MTIVGLGQTLREALPVLDEINNTWRAHSAALMMHPSASFGMWVAVQSSLERANITFQVLKMKVEPVVNSGKKRRLFKVHAKAGTLGLHVRSIATFRGCLGSHTTALKVGMHMMRMYDFLSFDAI